MNYQEFAQRVSDAGLTPVACNEVHWQIRGGKRIVNYYPSTRRGERFYVDRTPKAKNGPLTQAIAAALQDVTQPQIPGPIMDRWRQHRKSGGNLTPEQFYKRTLRRERNHDSVYDLDKQVRRQLAEDIYGDLPDGAFFAASEEMFGLDADDWIDP